MAKSRKAWVRKNKSGEFLVGDRERRLNESQPAAPLHAERRAHGTPFKAGDSRTPLVANEVFGGLQSYLEER